MPKCESTTPKTERYSPYDLNLERTPVKDSSQHILELFKSENQDKLYGLKAVRAKITDQLKNSKYATVDEINKEIFSKGENNTLDKNLREYKTKLNEHQKYSENRKNLGKHKDRDDALIARSCKFAMFYSDFKTIHFCLDNIDPARVITGLYVNKKTGDIISAPDFTSIELRCLAKNWNKLSSKVVFYDDGYKTNQTPEWLNELIKIHQIEDAKEKSTQLATLKKQYMQKLQKQADNVKQREARPPFSIETTDPFDHDSLSDDPCDYTLDEDIDTEEEEEEKEIEASEKPLFATPKRLFFQMS